MRFVTVRHEGLGRTARVPESRVPHLSKGWTVVTEASDMNPAVDDAPTFKPAANKAEATTTKEPVKARRTRKET